MDDIICTVAWTCGETDCRSPGGWHQSNYWTYGDGTYGIDNYADGDHESIEESDVPTAEQVAASWREYEAWVAENGLDPLHNYMVPKDVTTNTIRYAAVVRESIIGCVIVALRRSGRPVDIRREMERISGVRDFLDAEWLNGRAVIRESWLPSGPRLRDLATINGKKIRNHQLVVPFSVEVERPDADERASRWLKAKAGVNAML